MSPEQATGDQLVGTATDIYALGCVLYEMLVGEPPYTGSTPQAILGKIITGKLASATQERASVPANVDASIRKALEKLPADRFTGAQDFAGALSDPGFRHGELVGAEAAVAAGPWNRLTLALAGSTAVFAAILVGVLAWALFRPQEPWPVFRFTVVPPEGQELTSADSGVDIALSPDGSRLVYTGPSQLLQRRFDDLVIEPIPGTEGGRNPSFSPDGESLAFIVGGSLFTVSLLGGLPLTIVESGVRNGVHWGSDGQLYFTSLTGTIQRVSPEARGETQPVTTNTTGVYRWIDALPEGRGLLFTIMRSGQSEIAVLGFRAGEVVRTILPGVMARYAPSSGHLVYAAADRTLFAAPFDLERLELVGPSEPLLEGVRMTTRSAAQFALSATGTLMYV